MIYDDKSDTYIATQAELDRYDQFSKVETLTKEIKRLTNELHKERAILLLLDSGTSSKSIKEVLNEPKFKLS